MSFIIYSSICGYNNCHSFLQRKDEDIDEIEKFVRTKLAKILNKKCAEENTKFNDKTIFFGLFELCPEEFKFMRGERILMNAVFDAVQKKFAELKDNFASHYEMPQNYNKLRKDTDLFPVGVFFGKKVREQTVAVSNNPQIEKELLVKVKTLFKQFIDGGLKVVIPISKDIIKVVTAGKTLRGDVLCVFCVCNKNEITQKNIAVQYDIRIGANWNTSNLKKHLLRHWKDLDDGKSSDTTDAPDSSIVIASSDNVRTVHDLSESMDYDLNEETKLDTQSLDMSCLEFECTSSGTIDTGANDTKTIIYNQICTQNLNLLEATISNNERKKKMVIKRNSFSEPVNIHVINTTGDGDCLFSAFVHQLFLEKINSIRFKELTHDLRNNVVAHILNHFDTFKDEIKTRLEDEKNESFEDKDCLSFVKSELSQRGIWGGGETISAVQQLYKTNVIIFCENSTYYYCYGFNPKYDRTVFLAFRGNNYNNKTQYDHYDSVCEINNDLLYDSSCDLYERHQNNSSVIELQSP